jgi:hypothetical protein
VIGNSRAQICASDIDGSNVTGIFSRHRKCLLQLC